MTTAVSLLGPIELTPASIDRYVRTDLPGVYVLSRDGRAVHYVGRSDGDLAYRLKEHARDQHYSHFWYAYATSLTEAFNEETRLYHQYGADEKLDNQVHPAPPDRRLQCLWHPHA